jgi:glycosyltransferase involved in cell wall biosynthesis
MTVDTSLRAGPAPRSVSIIVPAYNEVDSIAPSLDCIREIMDATSYEYEILVIDDGSTDDTAARVGGPKVTLLRHTANKGYGAALKTGLRHAAYDVIAITDADGTYPSEEIPRLLADLKDYDMVVGARVGEVVEISWLRRFPKWILRHLASYLIKDEIPDLNSGLRVFRKDIAMQFYRLYPTGFSFTTTITLAMMSNDYLVHFVPINYFKRVGNSKIRPIRDTLNFFALIIRTIMYYRPLKIFGPVSLALLLAGLVRGCYNTVVHHNLTTVDLLLLLTGIIIAAIGLLADLIDKRG